MSEQLITNYFRLHNANQFIESVSEVANSVYYVFAGHHTPYDGGDAVIPSLVFSNDNTLYSPYEEMVFGKRVYPTDVVNLAPRYDWVSNTYYTAYRSTEDLSSKPFYVGVLNSSYYDVFKCLDNFSNGISTISPDVTQTSPDDAFYSTSDGYVWKYMYSVDITTFNQFATDQYIPVIANTQVSGNATPGAIDTIEITYRGSNYNTSLSNTFISTDLRVGGDTTKYNIANNAFAANNFYTGSFMYLVSGTGYGQGRKISGYTVVGTTKTVSLESPFTVPPDVSTLYQITPNVLITGDGTGCQARAIVDTSSSNTISSIEIIDNGQDYTFASAVVVGNTSGTSNTAVLTVIKGPKGGHGSNPQYELGATAVGISVSFSKDETGTLPVTNDFRSIGLIKDPLFSSVELTVSTFTGGFSIGETVTQPDTGTTGTVVSWDSISNLTLTNVNGILLTGNSTNNYVVGGTSGTQASVSTYTINGVNKNFNTFDQRRRYTFTPISGIFVEDEPIYQVNTATSNAIYYSNTASTMYLTHVKGSLNSLTPIFGNTSLAQATLVYSYPSDLMPGSGEILYYENESAVTRSASQTETIKIILQF